MNTAGRATAVLRWTGPAAVEIECRRPVQHTGHPGKGWMKQATSAEVTRERASCNITSTGIECEADGSRGAGAVATRGLWVSHAEAARAEACCVFAACGSGGVAGHQGHGHGHGKTSHAHDEWVPACATRVLPAPPSSPAPAAAGAGTPGPGNGADGGAGRKINLLSILIDPISKRHLSRALPRTVAVLEDLGFAAFQKHNVVGANSGPNQAALFAGAFGAERARLGMKDLRLKNRWLWDRLRKQGWSTTKVEDGCIRNSNMAQSLNVSTTHGHQVKEMFCFAFHRPNCIGSTLAADHAITFVEQFIARQTEDGKPWAAFLSLVDSHEDSMTLAGVLDAPISRFLSTVLAARSQDTVVMLVSDHGMHYGPYFSTYDGQREHRRPPLHIWLPPNAADDLASLELMRATMAANTAQVTTPLDVYATITDLLRLDANDGTTNTDAASGPGVSLTRHRISPARSCAEAHIPVQYCGEPPSPGFALLQAPPATLSFYSDLASDSKSALAIKRHVCGLKDPDTAQAASSLRECVCWTSEAKPANTWLPCSLPVQRFTGILAAVCSGGKITLYFATLPTGAQARERTGAGAGAGAAPNSATVAPPRPNLLIIQVDSVSRAHAARHLKATESVLRRAASRSTGKFAAFNFANASVAGSNSIPNQIALLRGCTQAPDSALHAPDAPAGADPASKWHQFRGLEHTFRVDRLNRTMLCEPEAASGVATDWLFNVHRNETSTVFAEEFCSQDSRWVIQDTFFNATAGFDYRLYDVYCALRHLAKAGGSVAITRYVGEGHMERILSTDLREQVRGKAPFLPANNVCYGGKPRFEWPFWLVAQLWEQAPGTTKFAFLNLMASHIDLEDPAILEYFDGLLARHLRTLLKSDTYANTAVLLHSDHGTQNAAVVHDWSGQVEQKQPWTWLLVPRALAGARGAAVGVANEDKLVTPYDLHKTLRGIIDPSPDPGQSHGPSWAFDLLAEHVPSDRSCYDARIPFACANASLPLCSTMGETPTVCATPGPVCYARTWVFCTPGGRCGGQLTKLRKHLNLCFLIGRCCRYCPLEREPSAAARPFDFLCATATILAPLECAWGTSRLCAPEHHQAGTRTLSEPVRKLPKSRKPCEPPLFVFPCSGTSPSL